MTAMLSRLTAIAAALALLAGPAAAQAPAPVARELAERLAQTEFDAVGPGFARAAGPFSGALAQEESQTLNVTLRAHQLYRIVAICERSCGRVHVQISDPNGQRVGVDRETPQAWVGDLRPQLTGNYTLRATMAHCMQARCWFALNIYAQ